MTPREVHVDWLQLCEPDGPFFSLPVVLDAFPHGLDKVDPGDRAQVLERWSDCAEVEDRSEFVDWLLDEPLGWRDQLRRRDALDASWRYEAKDRGEVVRPDAVLVGHKDEPLVMVMVLPAGHDPRERNRGQRWTASPVQKASLLCRATGCPLALLSDGDLFTLVHAPEDGSTGIGTWRANLFSSEKEHLASFITLLHLGRFLAVKDNQTPSALLEASALNEAELTDTLGRQARQAVELLVNAFSRADRLGGGQFLNGIDAQEVYEAAVTSLMRIVILLTAEERGLLPIDEEIYASSYAVSTMKSHLEEENQQLPEVLERRCTAWHRLLAITTAVHDGVEHPSFRVPPYGSRLFDPGRFPFLLEAGESGSPIPVDDLSMLYILRALQGVKIGGEFRPISFKNLAVEQIGHVYEGLLDHSAIRAEEVVVGLKGRKRGLEPEVPLAEIEKAAEQGAVVEFLVDQQVGTAKQIEKWLDDEVDDILNRRLREACSNDDTLVEQLLPYAHLLRTDLRGLPLVFGVGAVYVTETAAKRDSGTAYTTRDLAEEMAEHTLAPLVYRPGPAQTADRDEWQLISSVEILQLKVCDPAVGSGAILVAVCRYLAERLVEAWREEGVEPDRADVPVADDPDQSHVLVHARRLVAENCCYGVDRNPMAVEMAKLSLWLVTMARDRPFTFLDHAIVAGDSLLGITDIGQLSNYHLDPLRGAEVHSGRLFGNQEAIHLAIAEAREKRQLLESLPLRGIDDAVRKQQLLQEAEALTDRLSLIADSIVGAALATAVGGGADLDSELSVGLELACGVLEGDSISARRLRAITRKGLDTDLPPGQRPRKPLNWPLVFPEVLGPVDRPGFDALLGNPPFLGSQLIGKAMGSAVREFLTVQIAGGVRGKADLCAFFFLRADELSTTPSCVGFIATKTIAEGDTREVGLQQLFGRGWSVYRAVKSRSWPGAAMVVIAQVWMTQAAWEPKVVLDNSFVSRITSRLVVSGRVEGEPYSLAKNKGIAFQGTIILGMGFTLDPNEAEALIRAEPRNAEVLRPYLNGSDLNGSPRCEPSRWVVDFKELAEREARSYPACWEIVEREVMPDRRKKNRDRYRRMVDEWWKFWNPRKGLQLAIESLESVIVVTRTSKICQVAMVDNGAVFSDSLVVFASTDFGLFGQLSASLHWFWVDLNSSKLGTGFRYTPTDSFQTFPFCEPTEELVELGESLHRRRSEVMENREIGLTSLYGMLGDPLTNDDDIRELRRIHQALDEAVCRCYGWGDLELGHEFRETNAGQRFTISPEAQAEVLDRLLELNHQRYAEEVGAGLHQDAGATPPPKTRTRRDPDAQMLFEEGE